MASLPDLPTPFIAPDSPEWTPHDEGTRFGLDDQPTTCPHCGARTEESDNADGSQNHTCLRCGFRFVGDWDDWNEDEDEEEDRLPSIGDKVRVTGLLPFGASKPGELDPAPVPIGATGLVWNVVSTSSRPDWAQLWITWDPPHETRTLMLMGSDPFKVIPHPEHTECADGCGLDIDHDGPCLDKPGGRIVCEHDWEE